MVRCPSSATPSHVAPLRPGRLSGWAWHAALAVVFAWVGNARSAGLTLTSPSFAHGSAFPGKHTCDGAGLSPPLRWSGAPPGTESFALLLDDPDVVEGPRRQWALYDLPADATSLPEGVPPGPLLPSGGKQAANDRGEIHFAAPCAPAGKRHHFWFRVYALRSPIGLAPGASAADVAAALHGRVLAVAEVMGTHQR